MLLDHVHLTRETATLFVEGDLVEPADRRDLPFQLRFLQVLAFTVLELDAWLRTTRHDCEDNRAFFEVPGSPWLSIFSDKLRPDHRHFVLVTYDDVI
jgi:hypothetical protein